MQWGSGMMQWLDGAGEAAADAQDAQLLLQQQQYDLDQLGPSFVSPAVSEAPLAPSSSRSVPQGSLWVEQCSQRQQQSNLALPLERNERDLQAEALKVQCLLLMRVAVGCKNVTPHLSVLGRSSR